HIGKLNDGRKGILLVSEGFARPAHRRGFEGLPTIESVVRSASRYNVSVYAFNPQETESEPQRDGDPPRDAATLDALADGTDGRAAEDDAPLRQMVADSSAYYVLTYRSSQPNDGKFRDVQVRVSRAGVRVRGRKGYWGLWPDEARAAELLAKATEPVRAALPAAFSLPWRSSPLIRPWFGISRGDAGRTRMTFAWEPAPRVPGDR